MFIFTNAQYSNSQSSKAALLLEKLQLSQQDVDKATIYNSLSEYYSNKNPDSALLTAEKSLEIVQRIKYEKGIALANIVKGEALIALERFPEALQCEFTSLKLGEKLKLSSITEKAYADIGLVYAAVGNIPKALYYCQLSYSLAKSPDGTGLQSYHYLDLGNIYRQKLQYDSAIWYHSRALEIERKSGDSLTVAIALFNISENYRKKNMFEKSLPYLQESWEISRKIKDYVGLAFCNSAHGIIDYNRGNYISSIQYLKKGLEQAKKLNVRDVEKTCYEYLYLSYAKLGDYKEALEFRNKEVGLSDSLNAIKKEKEIQGIVTDYKLDQQNARIAWLEKEEKLRNEKIKTETKERNILIIGILLMTGLTLFAFTSYFQKDKLSLQLNKQNGEILEKNQQLEELNNVKNKLFSIVSHDMRGPIGSIRSIMDLMQANLMSEDEVKAVISKLDSNLLQTSQLLDNLLFWARSQMNGLRLNPKNFNINFLINQNIGLLQERANEKKITLKLETSNDPLLVNADEPTTDIVTRNLLENAIKFSNAGDEIIVNTKVSDNEVIVSVKDTGKGIAYVDQPKIFNRLTTHTSFGTAQEKGSGLGLLLCKELVEDNKGKIWFTSKPGDGSEFTFSLPLSDIPSIAPSIPNYQYI